MMNLEKKENRKKAYGRAELKLMGQPLSLSLQALSLCSCFSFPRTHEAFVCVILRPFQGQVG